uniref:Cationic amino acid transporter C-terminal domain-containing protein n=1 Tax=Equus caballus TaxID=9796 RepID=A0A9L0RI26_HORSE
MAWGLTSTASLARFCQRLNRLKTLEEPTKETLPQRRLTTLQLTLLGLGALTGFELYVLTGIVARKMAGPAVLVSFCVAAVASLLAALCYVEFAACVPSTGYSYLFTYVSMGELWAFVVGWNTIFQYLIAGVAGARACSGYLDAIFSYPIRSFIEAHVGIWQVPFLAQYLDFLAAGIALLASVFICYGAPLSSCLDYTSSAINLVVIVFIIILGFVLANPHNWSTEQGGFAPFSFSGIMAGAATCCYAFVGFDVVADSSMEARNPKRAVPMAIAISLGLVAGAYILVSTVLTLMVPWHSLDPDWAFVDAFYQRGYSWAAFMVEAASICAMITVLLFDLFSLPKIIHAMATDGLLLQVFTYMHSQIQAPVSPHPGGPPATAQAGHLSGTSSSQHPPCSAQPAPFAPSSSAMAGCTRAAGLGEVPVTPLTPALSILLDIFLMLHLSYLTWLGLFIWLLIGLAVYFGYGIWHSKENQRG